MGHRSFHVHNPVCKRPFQLCREAAWLTRKLLRLLWLDCYFCPPLEKREITQHFMVKLVSLSVQLRQDGQREQKHTALNSPNLTPRSCWVAFIWKQERLWITMWQSCSCAQTHSCWQWWQVADLWDRRKIMSLWWHIEHTCLATLGQARTHARTHKLINFLWVPQITKAATDRPIWAVQPPQHLLLSLLLGIHRHTELPRGIKAYINSRGPDTVNPDHNLHTSGSSAGQQDHVNAVLIKDC